MFVPPVKLCLPNCTTMYTAVQQWFVLCSNQKAVLDGRCLTSCCIDHSWTMGTAMRVLVVLLSVVLSTYAAKIAIGASKLRAVCRAHAKFLIAVRTSRLDILVKLDKPK